MHLLSFVEPVYSKSLPKKSVCAVNPANLFEQETVNPSDVIPVSCTPCRSVRCYEIPADQIGCDVILAGLTWLHAAFVNGPCSETSAKFRSMTRGSKVKGFGLGVSDILVIFIATVDSTRKILLYGPMTSGFELGSVRTLTTQPSSIFFKSTVTSSSS